MLSCLRGSPWSHALLRKCEVTSFPPATEPRVAPPPISCGVEWLPRTSCAFLKERRTSGLVLGPRTGNSGHLARFSRDVGYHCAVWATFDANRSKSANARAFWQSPQDG